MWILIFPLFTVLCLAVSLTRPVRVSLVLFRLALAGSVIPFLLHLWLTRGSVFGGGAPRAHSGDYPGLEAFVLVGALGITILLLVAWKLVPERLRTAALLPASAAMLYNMLALPLLAWHAPALVPLDRRPLFLLAGFTAHSTAMLMAAAFRMRRRMAAAGDAPRQM